MSQSSKQFYKNFKGGVPQFKIPGRTAEVNGFGEEAKIYNDFYYIMEML